MREPILLSVRKKNINFLKTRLVMFTILWVLVLLLVNLTWPASDSRSLVSRNILLSLVLILVYSCILLIYVKIRHLPELSIRIDIEGIHANKLFIPWDNIAAIYPITPGFSRVEGVGILPRDFKRTLGNLPAFVRFWLRWNYQLARNWRPDITPFVLRSDNMTAQELLERLWTEYYPEYQRYEISTQPAAQPIPLSTIRRQRFRQVLIFSCVVMVVLIGVDTVMNLFNAESAGNVIVTVGVIVLLLGDLFLLARPRRSV
jgi:hypothetical protein